MARRFTELQEVTRYESGLVKEELRRQNPPKSFSEAGYQVYSQWDEDGILQYLLRHVPIENDLFIEFGVEDYRESNTRYLLQKDHWRGVVLDAAPDALATLHDTHLYGWRDITFVEAFVTRESIDALLRPYAGDIGLLSIDIDGVDYFVWEAIECVSPRIAIVEYQPNFGPDRILTVPYRPDFDRTRHHYSNLCAGASIAALAELGTRKGYTLVGTSRGPNAFFVRNDVLGDLRPVSPSEAWREPRYRDSRDPEFGHTYITRLADKRSAMRDAIVLDLEDGREKTIAEVFGLTS